MAQKIINTKVLKPDSSNPGQAKKQSKTWMVYHYEYTNDFRTILIFEPNIFDDFKLAQNHASILNYLSGTFFYVVQEEDAAKLPLFKKLNVDDVL